MSQKESGAAFHRGDRPLSPHLQIYAMQMNTVMSIMHRITGIGLALGAALIVWWFAAAAAGAEAFSWADGFLTSIFGHLLLFGFTLASMYHLCNGVRHLLWDSGGGFALDEIRRSGWAVLIAALGLSLLIFIIGILD